MSNTAPTPTMAAEMLNRQRAALNPGAVETNRAGRVTGDQRFHLSARATGATLAWVSMTFFAMIASPWSWMLVNIAPADDA